ncbi:MAG: hypothetical protein GY940_41670 [bacterium]|nr:hypothetical protein [bacterium]
MSTSENYQEKIDRITAIPGDQIKKPTNIPIPIYIQEAENLHRWCQPDREKLTGLGLDWELVTDLPIRSGALIEAEAQWNAQRLEKKEASRNWSEQSPGAYKLRNELLRTFRFAFRKHDMLLKATRHAGKGRGHPDLIQDLNDLSALGRNNPELLQAINFDMKLLDLAAENSKKFGSMLAQASTERMRINKARKIRDQAYTYLKEVVDTIYEYGQFAFPKSNSRRKGYRSHHIHMKRKKVLRPPKKTTDNTPEPPIHSPGTAGTG